MVGGCECDEVSSVHLLAVIEVRTLIFHRDRETEAISFLMVTFQRHGSQVLGRHALGCRNFICIAMSTF